MMFSFSLALKSAEDFAKIKMRSYCEFKQCFVFRGAKPEEKLYGAVYATVDSQTGKNGYILGSDLPKTKWLPVEK